MGRGLCKLRIIIYYDMCCNTWVREKGYLPFPGREDSWRLDGDNILEWIIEEQVRVHKLDWGMGG